MVELGFRPTWLWNKDSKPTSLMLCNNALHLVNKWRQEREMPFLVGMASV